MKQNWKLNDLYLPLLTVSNRTFNKDFNSYAKPFYRKSKQMVCEISKQGLEK